MEFIYYTIAGLILYAVSDFILNKIEQVRGARFPNRSIVFLVIIMVLAVGSFSLIEHLTKDQTPAAQTALDSGAAPKPATENKN